MKKHIRFFMPIISFLLVFFTLFSLFFTVTEARHDCKKEENCGYCTQIETFEEEIETITDTHIECTAKECDVCSEIVKYENKLRAMRDAAHKCSDNGCSICLQIGNLAERFKSLFIFVVVFCAIASTICTVYWCFERKKELFRPLTLISLKVKLTD